MENDKNNVEHLASVAAHESGGSTVGSKTERLASGHEFFVKGHEFEASGKWSEASEYYFKAIACSPENGDYHFRLGKALYELKQFESATKALEEAKKIKPLAAHIHLYLGMVQDSEGKLEIAIKSLNLAVSLLTSPVSDFDKWHARIGGCYLRLGLFAEAEKSFSDAIALEPTYKSYWVRLCEALEKQNKNDEAIHAYTVAAEKTDSPTEFWTKGASLLMKLKRWDQAAHFAGKAISSESTPQLKLFNQLSEILRKDKKYWREIEVLEESMIHFPEAEKNWFLLGDARRIMGDWRQAAEAYTRAILLSPDNPGWRYRLGTVYEADGRYELAQQCYEHAISLERESQGLGVGWFHFQQGLWSEAIASFKIQVSLTPLNPTLYFFLASASEKCAAWLEAQEYYLKALSLDPSRLDLHLKLGFVSEKVEDWRVAADAYTYASRCVETKKSSQFALANLYTSIGEVELSSTMWVEYYADEYIVSSDGIEEYTKKRDEVSAELVLSTPSVSYIDRLNNQRIELVSAALNNDITDASLWWALGDAHNTIGDRVKAINCYRNALARENNLNPLWQHQLGCALYQDGQFSSANDVFSELSRWQKFNDKLSVQRDTVLSQKEALTYLHFFFDSTLSDTTIFYEVDHGDKFGGDPLAMFNQLLLSRPLEKWTHVWAFNDLACLPSVFSRVENVIAVQRGSPLYCKYLATSKYIVNNLAFQDYFIRKEGQRYLNTVLNENKVFDFSDQESLAYSGNVVRNLHHATHVLCNESEENCEFIERRTCLEFPSRKVINIGAPRLESRSTGQSQFREDILETLALDDRFPIALFLFKVRDEQFIDELLSLSCQPIECYEFDGKIKLRNFCNGREMVGVFDVLGTVCISHLLLVGNSQDFTDIKAIAGSIAIYSISDSKSQGDIAGAEVSLEFSSATKREILDKVKDVVERQSSTGNVIAEAPHGSVPMEDDSATQRAIKFFVDDICWQAVAREEKSVSLVFGGIFIPNGITKSFTNLLESIRSARNKLAIIVSPEAVFPFPERREIFFSLPEDVLSIYRVGGMTVTEEEEKVLAYFSQHNSFSSDEAREIYYRAFSREFLRVFGYIDWKSIVNFEGYNRFWTSMLATCLSTKKIVFLHSDMVSERKARFPSMEGLFKIYESYNYLVSVSQSMMEVNRDNLSERYNLPGDRFDYCQNTVDGNEVLINAQKDIDKDVEGWISGGLLFVSIGRLSTEKDHKKLIGAFVKALACGVDAKLIIIGEGPLRMSLEQQIIDLGAVGAIKLAGHLENPFPLLLRSDCFIHSSNHEGQPIVLLEAMVLGKPIIATDIAGNRGTLGADHGRIVSNDEGSIRDAIVEFSNDSLSSPGFDYASYNEQAVNKFFSIIDCN